MISASGKEKLAKSTSGRDTIINNLMKLLAKVHRGSN